MLLHANPVNFSDGLPSASDSQLGSQSDLGWSSGMPAQGHRPPPTFKTTAKTAPSADPGLPAPVMGRTRLAPLPGAHPNAAPGDDTAGPKPGQLQQQQQQQQQQYGSSMAAQLQAASPPPTEILQGTTYQTAHHAFVPKTRKKSAAPHAAIRGGWGTTGVTAGAGTAALGPSSAAMAAVLLQRVGMGSGGGSGDDSMSGTNQMDWGAVGRAAVGGPGTWGGASSVGDLEALDSILDQLVVLDTKMRHALLKGPLVSFETVVSESAARAGLVTEFPGNDRDHTFLTSVRGMVEEGEAADEEAQGMGMFTGGTLPAIPSATEVGSSNGGALPQQQQQSQYQGGRGQHQHGQQEEGYITLEGLGGSEEVDNATAVYRGTAIPVPILPKLARMYISSKQTAGLKAAPPPPPTAAWLLKSRLPMPTGAAPTYDNLVSQIKDVQRQYTCGTARDKATLAAEAARIPGVLRTNLDAYISGIDGPPLEDVVAPQLTPSLVERSRPTFVSMKRAAQSARRSLSKERLPGGSPRGPSPARGVNVTAAGPPPHHQHQQGLAGPDVQGMDQSGHESS